MKKIVSKKRSDKQRSLSRKKTVSGYVPCLPEYEKDFSGNMDFKKSLSDDDVSKELRKSKRA